MKILAIDYGEKRVGLAIGDTETKLALPHGVLERSADEALVHQLEQIVLEEEIETILVGDPIGTNNKSSTQTLVSRNFAEFLRSEVKVPVILFDERFTSQRADAIAMPGVNTRTRDEMAATFLLQDYIDRNNETI